ncbi:sensor histidine kinase [Luteimonas arsenica]|uniref:sensor histidine kinase n=1 Tax=Luteimonas arsenica TaxID=1586242 RepID=UPI001054F9C7|nr:ATP-binding protein [Luteimonas arsenica]
MKQEQSHGTSPGVAAAEPPLPQQPADAASDGDLGERLRACEAELARVLKDQQLVSYGIAHDLRAPLRAIEGFAAMLEATSGEALDATGRDHLARIRAAAARMAKLIDGLQALSRASHDHLDIGDVDASLLADWALVELGDAEPGRAHESSVQPGIRVRADERQLKQLFDHLLHNAWKFSAGRDAVRIEVDAERAGDTVTIHLRDHGSGFDPRHAERAFEPFQRVHGPDEGGGHGLGLAIAQRIAGRLGGRISVDTAPGEGSVFHVELPAAADGPPA